MSLVSLNAALRRDLLTRKKDLLVGENVGLLLQIPVWSTLFFVSKTFLNMVESSFSTMFPSGISYLKGIQWLQILSSVWSVYVGYDISFSLLSLFSFSEVSCVKMEWNHFHYFAVSVGPADMVPIAEYD